MPSICLATEDSLSESVGRRLIAELGSNIEVGLTFRKNGFGYLKANIDKFCRVAQRSPLFLITDLDKEKCAEKLISKWTGNRTLPKNFLFRVAVHEIEAWLLADHIGMRELLGEEARKLPLDPDQLPDPKQSLLRLASRAPRAVRNDLVVQPGIVASQGLGYNQRLGEFVRETWDPNRAASRSSSLSRTLKRLQQLSKEL